MTAGEYVSYAYVRQEDCNQPYIYETINRTITVPACQNSTSGSSTPLLSTDDAWVGPAGSSGQC